jgi:hypothetical protein
MLFCSKNKAEMKFREKKNFRQKKEAIFNFTGDFPRERFVSLCRQKSTYSRNNIDFLTPKALTKFNAGTSV